MFNYKKAVLCIVTLIMAFSIVAGCDTTDTNPTTTAPNTTTTTTTNSTTATTTQDVIKPAGVTVVAPTQAWSAAYDTPYLQQIEDDFDIDGAVEEIRLYYDAEYSRYVIAAWEYKALDHVFMFTVDEGVTWSLDLVNRNIYVIQTDANGEEIKYHLYSFNGTYGLETEDLVHHVNGDVTFRTSRYAYDIDGDGKEEYCVIEPLPDRPYHMFTFLVFQNEDDLAPKYYDVFDYSTMYDLAFAKTDDGELVLLGTRYGYEPTQQVWDIRIENNSIYLSVDGKDVRSYVKQPPDDISEAWFVNPSIYSDPRNTLYTDLNENGTDEKFCLAYTYETAGATEFEWALVTYNDNGTIDLWRSLGKHQVLEFYEENGNFYIKETTNGASKAFGKLIYNGEYSTVNIYE